MESSDSSIKLPEKYEILDEFFRGLDRSIRILGRKASSTTFTNISPIIESSTKRRFTYSHLAQLKFILPEAIEIKKILMHDERTNSMKPDLYIALRIPAIEKNGSLKSQSGNVELRKAFHLRLLDFFKAHPKGDDIPEEALPEPFNLSKKGIHTNLLTTSDTSAVGATPTGASLERQPIAASHFDGSFTRRFSKQDPGHVTGQVKQQERTAASHASVPPVSGLQIIAESKSCISASIIPMTLSSKERSNLESSSITVSLTGMRLSPPPATPLTDENCELFSQTREKKRKLLLESPVKLRQQMLARLQKLVGVIYSLFQSIRRSEITKEELIRKVIYSQLSIDDRGEVEEQLRLLLELVPEWIYEKSSNGDILLCVNKIPSPELVRNRLDEAKL